MKEGSEGTDEVLQEKGGRGEAKFHKRREGGTGAMLRGGREVGGRRIIREKGGGDRRNYARERRKGQEKFCERRE